MKNLDTVVAFLNQIAKDMPDYLAETKRLKESNISEEQIELIEDELSTKFPDEYKELLMKYDFSNLEIGSLEYFPLRKNLLKGLLEVNLDHDYYPFLKKNQNHIIIGNFEGGPICLSIADGKIYYFDHETGMPSTVNTSFVKMIICGANLEKAWRTPISLSKFMDIISDIENDDEVLKFWYDFGEIMMEE